MPGTNRPARSASFPGVSDLSPANTFNATVSRAAGRSAVEKGARNAQRYACEKPVEQRKPSTFDTRSPHPPPVMHPTPVRLRHGRRTPQPLQTPSCLFLV